MKRLTLIFGLLLSLATYAQTSRVYFTDKGENISLLTNPLSFLSPQAVYNKQLRGVVIDQSDLPVSRAYRDALSAEGLRIIGGSRWFNYALVEGKVNRNIKKLPFVKGIERVKQSTVHFAEIPSATNQLAYGLSQNQIEMVNGNYLHSNGWMGQGMTIAVIDGGFGGAQSQIGLDSLWSDNRVLGTYNFVNGDTNVFLGGDHGTKVLTILAGYIDSAYVGSAYKANYWLLSSEKEIGETVAEMDNWLRAAEFADSVGADVISSSLGYNTFDGGVGDLSYEDMDGNTALVTRAADMAAKKGLLVVVSAGNEGGSSWEHITAPADGDSVLAIGGVDNKERYASFSSTGPTADGRIKPDVVAVASGTAFISPAGPTYGNGTSFSCPIISGLAACLWQAYPSLSNMEIFEAIRSNASQPYRPDNYLGFGIANFRDASWSVGINEEVNLEQAVKVYPNPVGNEFFVEFSGEETGVVQITILDINGKEVFKAEQRYEQSEPIKIEAPRQKGVYFVSIHIGDNTYLHKISK